MIVTSLISQALARDNNHLTSLLLRQDLFSLIPGEYFQKPLWNRFAFAISLVRIAPFHIPASLVKASMDNVFF